MEIRVNGETRYVDGPLSIQDFIAGAGLTSEHVVVERNRQIAKRDTWERTTIQPGDSLEIVEFVGGG